MFTGPAFRSEPCFFLPTLTSARCTVCGQAFMKSIFLLFCCEGGLTAKCTQQTFPCCSSKSSS